MNKSKYIILDDQGEGIPVVFSPLIQHDHMACGRSVISAGFCDVTVTEENGCEATEWYVWGESISLNKKSRPEDKDILNRLLRFDC